MEGLKGSDTEWQEKRTAHMERFDLAQKLVTEAGARLRRECFRENQVQRKTDHQDLVTCWDRETEQFLRSRLLEAFPEDTVTGEEFGREGDGTSGVVWYIDPIDGTTNFISERRDYAVCAGCYMGGTPCFGLVLDVARDRLYSGRTGMGAFCNGESIHTAIRQEAEEMLLLTPDILHTFLKPHPRQRALIRLTEELRGVRSRGSVALELCAVAEGEADLFVTTRSCPWDHNGARIILTEAGGAICTLDGERLPADENSTILAGSSAASVALIKDKLGI